MFSNTVNCFIDSSFHPSPLPGQPQLLSHAMLNDLCKDLFLSKELSEVLASRLRGLNLLEPGVTVTSFRQNDQKFRRFFENDSNENDIVQNRAYCKDINGLFTEFNITHKPDEWRLFIDSSVNSLKAALIHNGNRLKSVPIYYGTKCKETKEIIENLLQKINYEHFQWPICADLKVVNILLGQQHGYTSNPCFKCLWNSRSANSYTAKAASEPRGAPVVGKHNILYQPLVDSRKIIIPPLHVKLGIVKNFIKALDRDGDAFARLRQIFPGITPAKLNEGIHRF